MDEKMKLYNAFRAVPRNACKQFSNGRFSGTDINPMWRIERLTEVLGPAGFGWYFGEPVFTENSTNGIVTVFCRVALYVRDGDKWSAPCWGVGGNTLCDKSGRVSDEAYKMAYTDAQSNAAKLLGLGADVWFATSETKYTAKKPTDPAFAKAVAEANSAKSRDEIMAVWSKYTQYQQQDEFLQAVQDVARKYPKQ